MFLLLLTVIVVGALFMTSKADLHDKEKRDTILLIATLFISVLALNEIQNLHITVPTDEFHNLQDYFTIGS